MKSRCLISPPKTRSSSVTRHPAGAVEGMAKTAASMRTGEARGHNRGGLSR